MQEKEGKMDCKYKTSPPKGFKWIASSVPVAGLEYNQAAVKKFLSSSNQEMIIAREPFNQHDPNSITIFHGENLLGRLPKEISSILSELPKDTPLKCALKEIYTGSGAPWIKVSLFAQTKIKLGNIYDRCQTEVDKRFYSGKKNRKNTSVEKGKFGCFSLLILVVVLMAIFIFGIMAMTIFSR